MLRRAQQHERPTAELGARHAAEVIGCRDECHVEVTLAHLLDQIVRPGLREVDVDERVTSSEPLEQRRDIHDPEALLGTDPQLAGEFVRGAHDRVAPGHGLGEHGARMGEQRESGVGRLDPAGRTREQGSAELILEAADRGGQTRLRNPAHGGRAGELLLVGECDEVFHLTQIH